MELQDLSSLQQLMGTNDPAALQKALTVSNGFLGINLEPAAKLMLPVYAGLRNSIAVDKAATGGRQAIWRMQLGYGGFDFATNLGTAFAAVGGATAGNATSISANYQTQSINGQVEFEALAMAQGYDDALSIETRRALATLLRLEEIAILGGNQSAISSPVVAGAASTLVGAATFGAGNWKVQVTAITTQGSIANASGNSNVGESVAAAATTIVVPVGGVAFLDVSWAPVAGAIGYKVYVGAAAAGATCYLVNPATDLRYTNGALAALGDVIVPTSAGQTYVGVTRVQVVAAGNAANPVPPVADGSANANIFEGMLSWATKSTVYGTSVGSHIGVDAAGAALTTNGSGITEFDTVLSNLWSQWQITPTRIITSPQGANSITNQLMSLSNALGYRIYVGPEAGQQGQGGMVGGAFMKGYLNKFAAAAFGEDNSIIPVYPHPYMPDGTFMFISERVPYQYANEARGFALDVLTPYTYFDLARTQRQFNFSIFETETLKCYHPLAQAAVTGARVA